MPFLNFAFWFQANTPPVTEGELPGGEGNYLGLLFRMIFYLALICGAIYMAMRYLMPKIFRWRMPGGSAMAVVDRIPVGTGKTVCVVRAVGRYYLIGVADGSVRMLTELDEKEVTAHYPNIRESVEK